MRFSGLRLPKDSSSFARVLTSSGTTSPFSLSRVIGCASRLLSSAFFQDHDFFQSGLAAGHSRVVSARLDLVTLSSVLLVPLAFSPCLDANGGIDLLAIGSSECSSLGLPRVN